jgi:hypothetical protein
MRDQAGKASAAADDLQIFRAVLEAWALALDIRTVREIYWDKSIYPPIVPPPNVGYWHLTDIKSHLFSLRQCGPPRRRIAKPFFRFGSGVGTLASIAFDQSEFHVVRADAPVHVDELSRCQFTLSHGLLVVTHVDSWPGN